MFKSFSDSDLLPPSSIYKDFCNYIWITKSSNPPFSRAADKEFATLIASSTLIAFAMEPNVLTGSKDYDRGFPGGSAVKNLPAMQKTWVQSLSWEDPLEKGMATPL